MQDRPDRIDEGDNDVVFDEDNPEWTEEDFARAKPISEAPEWLRAAFTGPGRRAIPVAEKKQQVTLRLSPKVLAHFRATGKGWQTKINEALKRAIGSP